MAPSLKKLANRGKLALICVLIAGILLIAFLGLCIYEAAKPDKAVRYVPGDTLEPGQCLFVPVQLADVQFASYSDGGDEGFYLVFSSDMTAEGYVVYGGKELDEALLPYQDYAFGQSSTPPAPLLLTGYPQAIPLDLKPFILEECEYLFGEQLITEENFNSIFGAYYLDTTSNPTADAMFVFWFFIIAIVAITLILLRKDAKADAVTKDTCSRLAPQTLQQAADELALDVLTLEHLAIRLTRHFLISYRGGLQLVPLAELVSFARWPCSPKVRVALYLQDGGKLLLPPYRNSAAAQREYDQLADALSQLAIGFG